MKLNYQEALDLFCNSYCEENDGAYECVNDCVCKNVLQKAVHKAELYDKRIEHKKEDG